ncbi:two-component system histidine kinase PnpS [Calidifontibacillus erzurumensis]|uniref:histidine kinase n=1 Tax=Calidifontibacillus erzurumensis TaxID=2741433 RepID=A0A8J8GGB4_9BACI|nr:ATP-binding protein [Calidifontibacillus erzurumensis]NSL51268.1 PAS domain-containing protein [Calidifontibacillus erzurumensis]
MNKLRTKIIVSVLLVIGSIFAGLGIMTIKVLENFHNNTYVQKIKNEASLVELMIKDQDISEMKEKLRRLEKSMKTDITVILSNGTIYSKGNDQYSLEKLYQTFPQLEEIIDQKRTKFKDVHVMDEEKGIIHYVMPIQNDNQYNGYLIFSQQIEPFQIMKEKMSILLVIYFVAAYFLILLVGTIISKQHLNPIESAVLVVNELAKGNYQARTYEYRTDETGILARSINHLARNLQKLKSSQEMQQDRLKALIENMGSGLILIDGKGYINLVNRYFKDIFKINIDQFMAKLYYEAIEHKEIIELVEEIFITEKAVRKQLMVSFHTSRRHFEVYGAPIIGKKEEWRGVVLVFHDITGLKKLEQMRKDFVANVSHELKTPMTSIKGFSETLLDGALEDKEMAKYFLNIILKETDRLQSLINDLLDLSNIEQESFTLNITEVNIKHVLEDVAVMLQNKAKEKEVLLQLENVEDDIIVEGDLYRIKQIFINLITNAIKYTPKDGKVKINCFNFVDRCKINISDTGIGIEKDEIPRIFERFYRVDKARTRNSGGTGLGLAIVKHLVDAHHGEIEVISKINEGTTFSVILPKKHINK